jgi:hypothetical protein
VHWLSYHVQLGDLPTWLAAIGAGIAAWFAFGQLRALRNQNRIQQQELDQQAHDLARVEETQRKQTELLDLEIRDRRAAQARLITVDRFVERWNEPDSTIQDGYALYLRVTNNSPGAISNLDAFFAQPGEVPRRGLYSLTVARTPAEARRNRSQRGQVPVTRLDPGTIVSLIGPTYGHQAAHHTNGELRFIDSDGRRWKLDHTGRLTDDLPTAAHDDA